jgi:aspartate 1-decarboxylase
LLTKLIPLNKDHSGMRIPALYAKLHRATVTNADLHYEGSISIDTALLSASGIQPWQQVQVYNVTNGARFETYAIAGEAGQIQVNGAAARLAQKGDLLIIAAFADFSPEELETWQPTVVLLDEANQLKEPLPQHG